MKRILVAVDGSEISMGAANFAADIARSMGCALQLACAIELTISYGEYTTGEVLAELDADKRTKANGVLAHAHAMLSLRGIAAETISLHSPAADAIAELAKGEVDLVVVGHRSRNLVKRALLGSVADRLVQICPKPVLVFRFPIAG